MLPFAVARVMRIAAWSLPITFAGCARMGACGCVPPGPPILPTPFVPASTVRSTPACAEPAGVPATTAAACTVAPLDLLSTQDPYAVLCAPGPGCAESSLDLSLAAGFGTVTGSVPSNVATFGSRADVSPSTIFRVTAVAPGDASVGFADAAEAKTVGVALSVVPAAANDGAVTLAGPAVTGFRCIDEPFTLAFSSPRPVAVTSGPNFAGTISAPTLLGSLTTVTVSGAGPFYENSYLVATSGPDALIVPMNLEACRTQSADRSE